MQFEEYYKNIGFKEYPFGVFTTESEGEKREDLYVKPQNYSVIVEGLRNTSAVVIGERGTGKTALALDIEKDLKSGNNLVLRIEDFSPLKSDFESKDLYRFLIENIASVFFMDASENPKKLWTLSKDDRVDLSLYLHSYLGASSKDLLRDKISRIQNKPLKKFGINFFNFFRVFLNYGLSATTKVANDILTKHFPSLPEIDETEKEYFKRLEIEVDDSFTENDREFRNLKRLCSLIKKTGTQKIYVILDRIDEDTRFDNDAELVGQYIKKIAADNKIITSEFMHVLMFFWSTPFNEIKNSVRTQKITFQPLGWDTESLKKVLSKRLEIFSEGDINSYKTIFHNPGSGNIQEIFKMANNNPRDLWHIVDKCIKAQHGLDQKRLITDHAIQRGIHNFVVTFNYYEYYPRKAKSQRNTMDVYSYIKHLLKLEDYRFTKNQFSDKAKTGGSTNNYVTSMENMGLIKKTNEKGKHGSVIYEINDPKIIYAMDNGIAIEK